MELRGRIETLQSEGLKTAAEIALSSLGKFSLGERVIERYAFGEEGRIEDDALCTTVAGIEFENPIMVGAGWDKKGRAVRGLYNLGFSGVEVGTVPLYGQPGNLKPRMWTMGRRHGVGLNRLGFNSPGSEVVDRYLEKGEPFPCPVGINVGKNKVTPDEQSPWTHAEVVRQLYEHASYFVFNPSSPNTEDLRKLQRRQPMRDHIKSMQDAMAEKGDAKPLFVKIAPDLTFRELDDIIEVAVEEEASGIVNINTTSSKAIKAMYGKQDEPGGLSGNFWEYRSIALNMTAYIYEAAGDKLDIIGVGAISQPEHAIDRMLVGASMLQVVTAIREQKGRTPAIINRGILEWMNRHSVENIQEIIGHATKRGPKYPKDQTDPQDRPVI